MQAQFWTSFCDSAGVFCLGEVFGDDIGSVARCFMRLEKVLMHDSRLASSYQQAMDAVLNYPLYDAIVQAFSIPGPANMSGLAAIMGQIQNSFKVCFASFTIVVTSNMSF